MATLNTRIQLKYDSFSSWQTNNPTLLAGEIAIATLAPAKDTNSVTPDNGTHPVLFKVGPGNFNDLPWASALAADVYSWAKKAALDANDLPQIPASKLPSIPVDKLPDLGFTVVDNGTGKFITDAVYDSANKTLTLSRADAVNSLTATDDDVVILTVDKSTGDVTIDAKHADYAAGSAKTPSTASISDYGETATIKIPKLVSNDQGHITEIKEETVTITLPEAPEEVQIPNIVITDDAAPEVPSAATVNVYKNLTASEHTLTEELVQVATAAGVAAALQEAKQYADDNDADTKYGIEYDSTNKKIKLTSDTSKTEIDANAFIKDGMITSVELNDNNELVITWNTDADKGENSVTEIPLSGLVDVYTGVDGTTVKVEVSDDNKISAEVKDGSIVKTKLASAVQTSLGLADSAVQEADLGTMAKANTTDYLTKAQIEAGYQPVGNYQPAGDYKTKQSAVSSPAASGSALAFIDSISQNANGVITATKKNVELPAVNNGKFTVSGTGSLTGSGSMTANQAGDTTASLDIAAKGVTTAKLADGAVGAAQTKASSTYTGSDKEVWIFNCGSSSVNV